MRGIGPYRMVTFTRSGLYKNRIIGLQYYSQAANWAANSPWLLTFAQTVIVGYYHIQKKNPCYYLGKVTLMVDLIKYRLEVVYNNDYAIYQPQGTKTIFVNREGL